MKNFLKSKAYYIVLLGCVVALCVGGIFVLKDRTDNNDPVVAKPSSTPAPTVTKTPSSSTATEVPSGGDPVNNPKTEKPSPSPSTSPNVVKMTMPLDGDVKTGYAIDRLVYNKTLKEWRTHPAIDIAGEVGAEVKSADDGTIADIKTDPHYGLTIIVDHGNDLKTVYSGLAVNSEVTVGSTVSAGDVIGKLGTGAFIEQADGAHLHFEVVQNGKKVDPSLFLDIDK
jgi:murein DD-endopeptidase MepM/ murein hydrolase activator NlpD